MSFAFGNNLNIFSRIAIQLAATNNIIFIRTALNNIKGCVIKSYLFKKPSTEFLKLCTYIVFRIAKYKYIHIFDSYASQIQIYYNFMINR